MEEALYIISNVVRIALTVLQLAMLVRAVLSWFPIEPNGFIEFLQVITEPLIYPFRALFARLNWFQNSPIDMSFVAASIVLLILTFLL